MRKSYIIIILALLAAPGYAQITLTPGNGYIEQAAGMSSTVVRKEAVLTAADVNSLAVSERTIVHNYTDGFGRPIQQIVQGSSVNNKDIIAIQKYNAQGIQNRAYLPYEGADNIGKYTDPATALTAQANFYTANLYSGKVAQDTYPWAETVFEPSPMQRVLQQGKIGNGYQPLQNVQQFTHRPNNTGTETVRKWTSAGSSTATYANGDLWVSEGRDEANTYNRIYTDKMGRTILKRVEGPSSTWLDTYYVYDAAGNVVYVIQPKAVEKMASLANYNITATPNLVFSYVYDHKNRVVEKKTPGTNGAVFLIYDPLDRLVLMQDANMRAAGGAKWLYTKYDGGGRVVVQGMYTHASVLTRQQMQTHVNGQACYGSSSTTFYEQRTAANATGYTDVCFPVNGSGGTTEDRQYNFYDDYNFDYDNFNTPDYSYSPQGLPGEANAVTSTEGLPTGQKRRILGTSNWLINVNFYDRYLNVIQVKSNNQLTLAVNDHSTTVISFEGNATYSKQYKTTPSVTLTVQTRNIFDAAGRMTELKQSNNGGTEYSVAKYEYNALNQLIDKKLHSTNGTTWLQSVDYRYSIRGQLLSLNNSSRTVNAANNDDANDVFGMEWLYEQTDANIGNTASYTGMVSAVKWSATNPTNSTPDNKAFVYTYDKLYRLTAAVYKGRAHGGSGSFTKELNGYNENFAYDANGNITSLQRNAWMTGTATQIDNLTYTYSGSADNNQLASIADAQATNAAGWGFRNFTGSGGGYTYDDNGNLTVDAKKGTTISYNDIDKPVSIVKTATKKVEYIYDAAGTRLAKLVYNNSATVTKRIDYIGGMVLENNTLSYFGMAEGRIRNDAGTLKAEYFITDLQGNVRSSFEDGGSGTAVVRQQTDYYAYGMIITGAYNAGAANDNKNLYNAGSEWQADIEDGIADYYSTFFREYDAVIGRFNGVDPQAKAGDDWTVYNYAFGNPVLLNDPFGDNPPAFESRYEYVRQMQAEYLAWHESRYLSMRDWLGIGALDIEVAMSHGATYYGKNGVSITEFEFYASVGGMQLRLQYSGSENIKFDRHGNLGFWSHSWGDGVYEYGINLPESIVRLQFNVLQPSASSQPQGSTGVGQPGMSEGLIPIWGSARAATDDFQNGRWAWGIFNTAMAISDVFLVKSLVVGLAKAAVRQTTKSAAKGVTQAESKVFLVTREGVVLPKGAKIPGEFVENAHRSSNYGIMQNGKFVEKLRIDPATPAGMKGPNFSHYHLNGSGKHLTGNWPWW